jgi:hypothetical protein
MPRIIFKRINLHLFFKLIKLYMNLYEKLNQFAFFLDLSRVEKAKYNMLANKVIYIVTEIKARALLFRSFCFLRKYRKFSHTYYVRKQKKTRKTVREKKVCAIEINLSYKLKYVFSAYQFIFCSSRKKSAICWFRALFFLSY